MIADFEHEGYSWHRAAVPEEDLQRVEAALEASTQVASPNRRNLLQDCPAVAALAQGAALQRVTEALIGAGARAVRALLFDKVPGANWGVPWHQDQAIAVAERRDVPGFYGWSVKEGVPHVLPPTEVLDRMVTLRLHLDDCPAANGALRVIPGSHAEGRLNDSQTDRWKALGREVVCEARRGDVLAMRPLILHASSAATQVAHRRVIHLEYSTDSLPGGLHWYEEAPLFHESHSTRRAEKV